MEEWARLMEAGHELSRAYSMLDRAAEIACATTVAAITKDGLVRAASQAVTQVNALLCR